MDPEAPKLLEDADPGHLALGAGRLEARCADRPGERQDDSDEIAQLRLPRPRSGLGCAARDEVVEQPAELPLDVDVAIRSRDDPEVA